MDRTPAIACVVMLAIAGAAAFAVDPPDAEVNPRTGLIETTESYVANGQTNVRHVIDPGQGAPSIITKLTNGSAPDLAPRIAIRSDGTTGVAWWRDVGTDAVYTKIHDHGEAHWSSEIRMSASDEGSRDPVIVSDGTTLWVAFVVDLPGGNTGIATNGVREDPVPIGLRELVGSTSFTGDLDVLLHYDLEHLWVSWDDGSYLAGWAEYDDEEEEWGLPDYESYATDTLDDARDRIRTEVLGN